MHNLWTRSLNEFETPEHLHNLFNANMNNVDSIDFSLKHWTFDNDGTISRWSNEFPRTSNKYLKKSDIDQIPWGGISEPKYFDCWQDAKLQNTSF